MSDTNSPAGTETCEHSDASDGACDACGESSSEFCDHSELDHGICLDCGGEVDWVSRMFRDSDND